MECKDFRYLIRLVPVYEKEIRKLKRIKDESLEYLETRQCGLVQRFDMNGNSGTHNGINHILWIKKKDDVKRNYDKKIAFFENNIQEIYRVINLLDPTTQEMVKDLYFYGKSGEDTAYKFGYSKQGLYDVVNRELEKALQLHEECEIDRMNGEE